MAEPLDTEQALLDEARGKARRLIEELRADQADLEARPPKLPADQLAQGMTAFQNAIAAAERMLQALDDAAQIQPGSVGSDKQEGR